MPPASPSELTVVIPTLRAAKLARVLDDLDAQEGATGRFDVVVVSDAKAPDPDAGARLVAGRHFPAQALNASVPGASGARNVGWRAARAPLVLFIGDDTLPEPGLIAAHLAAHARHPEESVAVLGRVDWADELHVTPFMRWVERGFQFDFGSIEDGEAGWGRFYTSNVSVKRALLEKVGGFDEERLPYRYEDLDIAKRMHDGFGLRVVFEPSARVGHLHEMTLEDWRDQIAVNARAEHAYVAKHPDADAYFHRIFAAAAAEPPARGRWARLARVVGPGVPVLGRRVWRSVDAQYRHALAPSFLAAWEECERAAGR